MAGIGFEIRKLMDRQTFEGDFKAYFFAGIVSSGPWVVSILGVALLWMFSASYFGMPVQKFFRVVVVYTYAYSLILTGFIQFILTRFLSDKLYLRERNILLPTYIGVLIVTTVVQGIIATVFYSFCDVDLHFKLIGIILFITVSCIWQTMIFLSASRDFMSITAAFFFGNMLGIGLAIVLGRTIGFNGHILGYTIGQAVLLFLLMYRIFFEFDSEVSCSFEFLLYLKKYFNLFLIGVAYYLGIWIDKIIYWYLPVGQNVKTLFYSNYPYDSCMFLAFLTIIPALAHFMIDVETNFYEGYREFYGAIINKGTYADISRRKKEMGDILSGAISRMVMLQVVITGSYIYFSPFSIRFLQLQSEFIYVFVAAGIGAFFHLFLLLCLILILYFDRRGAALILSVFFLCANTVFTFVVAKFFPNFMGWGYAAAASLSTLLGVILLRLNMRDIEYLTFVEQPILKPKLPQVETEEV